MNAQNKALLNNSPGTHSRNLYKKLVREKKLVRKSTCMSDTHAGGIEQKQLLCKFLHRVSWILPFLFLKGEEGNVNSCILGYVKSGAKPYSCQCVFRITSTVSLSCEKFARLTCFLACFFLLKFLECMSWV